MRERSCKRRDAGSITWAALGRDEAGSRSLLNTRLKPEFVEEAMKIFLANDEQLEGYTVHSRI